MSLGAINQAISFLRHYVSAGNEHDVHSPFVFHLLTKALYLKSKEPVFYKIESARKQLLCDNREITVTDLGAGSSFDGHLNKRTIADITRKFAKATRHCQFLYRMTAYLKPGIMIELGTSLGLSAMYQAAGNDNGQLYTLEGCEETANLARDNFKKLQIKNIECITGNFDDTLPVLLNATGQFDYAYIDGNHTLNATLNYYELLKKYLKKHSVIILDDIYWSNGMKQAWNKIKSDPQVTISLDFYQFGVVFFNRNLTPQKFKLRL